MSFAYPQTYQPRLLLYHWPLHVLWQRVRYFDGCYGGAIWIDDFDVVGQFRFMMKDETVAYYPSHGIENLSEVEVLISLKSYNGRQVLAADTF